MWCPSVWDNWALTWYSFSFSGTVWILCYPFLTILLRMEFIGLMRNYSFQIQLLEVFFLILLKGIVLCSLCFFVDYLHVLERFTFIIYGFTHLFRKFTYALNFEYHWFAKTNIWSLPASLISNSFIGFSLTIFLPEKSLMFWN